MIKKLENFLLSRLPDDMIRLASFLVVVLGFFSFVIRQGNWLAWPDLLLLNVLIVLFFCFVKWPRWGLYSIGLIWPFWGWVFLSQKINVPYVDLLGLTLFLAMLLRTFFALISGRAKDTDEEKIILNKWPAVGAFLIFVLAALLTVFFNEQGMMALKYLARPIVFAYLVYLVLPYNLLTSKKAWQKMARCMVFGALMTGALAVIAIFEGTGFSILRQAQPITVFGYNFLGGNHNALAEIMIGTLPLVLILHFLSGRFTTRGRYFLATVFVMLMCLLTFSRAGWLALLLEILIAFVFLYAPLLPKRKVILYIFSGLILLSAVYVLVWGQIQDLAGANSSRWLMTSIAWERFSSAPIIGNGLNTFNEMLSHTFAYWVEFGDPLDSHGFVQKIGVEIGLFGLFAFFLFLASLFKKYFHGYKDAFKNKKPILVFFLALFFGVLFFQLFSTSYYLIKLWLPLGVGLAGVKLFKK